MDPTARGDMIADKVRQWYETNRESWWERRRTLFHEPDRSGVHADEFMLRLIGAVHKAEADVAALSSGPCDGCDGHECDNGCAYPGAAANSSGDRS